MGHPKIGQSPKCLSNCIPEAQVWVVPEGERLQRVDAGEGEERGARGAEHQRGGGPQGQVLRILGTAETGREMTYATF